MRLFGPLPLVCLVSPGLWLTSAAATGSAQEARGRQWRHHSRQIGPLGRRQANARRQCLSCFPFGRPSEIRFWSQNRHRNEHQRTAEGCQPLPRNQTSRRRLTHFFFVFFSFFDSFELLLLLFLSFFNTWNKWIIRIKISNVISSHELDWSRIEAGSKLDRGWIENNDNNDSNDSNDNNVGNVGVVYRLGLPARVHRVHAPRQGGNLRRNLSYFGRSRQADRLLIVHERRTDQEPHGKVSAAAKTNGNWQMDVQLTWCVWTYEWKRRLVGDSPNVYGFTKGLAEKLLQNEYGDLPVCIVRPSIVTATLKEPLPGWVDNLNGPTGLISGVGKGLLRALKVNADMVGDIIPVEFPINLMIVAACYRAIKPTNKITVYNCSTGTQNPITWGEIKNHAMTSWAKFPANDMLWYPHCNFSLNPIVHNLRVCLFHYFPAYLYDLTARLVGKKPMLVTTSFSSRPLQLPS